MRKRGRGERQPPGYSPFARFAVAFPRLVSRCAATSLSAPKRTPAVVRIHALLARLWGILVPPESLDDAKPAKVVRVRDVDAEDAKSVKREA